MKKIILTLAFALAFSFFAYAMPHLPAPAINGPTGVVRIPSADVLPYKNLNLGADYGTKASTSEPQLFYKMNLGTFQGVELGIVGGLNQAGTRLREGVFINLKYSLATQEEAYPLKLAIGAENLASYNDVDVFMVATKYLKGFNLTFGFLADFPNNKFRPSGMVGTEYGLGNNLFLLGDWLKGETLSQVNIGARFYLMPTIAINASCLNFLNDATAKDEKSIFTGLSWANPF